ncbi:MAG: pyocin knob domain-containing protein [Bacteroidales bacterium]
MADKLNFPNNPVKDQEYVFPPFRYRYDGEKWKTLGRGSDPVADAIVEHKQDSKAHDPARIGALPINGSAPMTAPLNVTTNNNEAIVINYGSGTDGGHLRGREAGALDWYVGRANIGGDVAMYSNKHANGLILRSDFIEAVKGIKVGSAGTVYYNQRAGSADLNLFSSIEDCGIYYQDANANASPANHYPIQEAGTLMVTGSAYGVQQEYTAFTTGRKFVRGKSAAGSASWYPWNEVGGPKHHMSGYRFTEVTIPVNGTMNLMPSVFASSLGITMSNGTCNISRTATYKVSWGFTVLPRADAQNGVGGLMVNGVMTYSDMIHNYCPANTIGSQMNISSTSIIIKLNAGDRLNFQVKAVNNTSVYVYQGGFIAIEELY